MTHFGFHLRFLLPPILMLGLSLLRDYRRGKWLADSGQPLPAAPGARRLTNILIVFGMTLFMGLPGVTVRPWKRYGVPSEVSEHEA